MTVETIKEVDQPICPECHSPEEHAERVQVDTLVRLRATFDFGTPEHEALSYAIYELDWDNDDNEAPPVEWPVNMDTLIRLREMFVSGTPEYDALNWSPLGVLPLVAGAGK